MPISETYPWDNPFLGVVLAGVFTSGSLNQLTSRGFTILYFSYDLIVNAFATVGINVEFDESTPDDVFGACVHEIEQLSYSDLAKVKRKLTESNETEIQRFLDELKSSVDRMIDRILIIPLYGAESSFENLADAVNFMNSYDIYDGSGDFRKYEINVRFTNGDTISASLADKDKAIRFLQYVGGADATTYA